MYDINDVAFITGEGSAPRVAAWLNAYADFVPAWIEAIEAKGYSYNNAAAICLQAVNAQTRRLGFGRAAAADNGHAYRFTMAMRRTIRDLPAR